MYIIYCQLKKKNILPYQKNVMAQKVMLIILQ